MNTVSGQDLVDRLNELSKKAKKRLWIASPYLGEFNAIQRILGSETLCNFNLDFRLLVDYSECGNCNYDSMKILLKSMPGSIKSLPALHAKIYIIDDDCLLTSANLTRTAFERRFEIGTFFNTSEMAHAVKIYESYWNKGKNIRFEDLKRSKESAAEVQNGEAKKRYRKKFNLPKLVRTQNWLKILGFSNKVQRLEDFQITKESKHRLKGFLGTPKGNNLMKNDIVYLLRLGVKNGRNVRCVYGRAKVDVTQKESRTDLREYLKYVDKEQLKKFQLTYEDVEHSINKWPLGFWIKDVEIIVGNVKDFIELDDLKFENGTPIVKPTSISQQSHIRLSKAQAKTIDRVLDKIFRDSSKRLFVSNPTAVWLNKYITDSDHNVKKPPLRH